MIESATETFEDVARQFCEDTHLLAPGKDAAGDQPDREIRVYAWTAWLAAKARFQNNKLAKALLECESYFDDRADADCVGDPAELRPNQEMRLLTIVRRALGSS